MSSDSIQEVHETAQKNLARLDNLLSWVIYAKSQLNGDENPALIEALDNISLGIAAVDIDADKLVQLLGGLTEALRTAVRQRDDALANVHRLIKEQGEMACAVQDEVAYLLHLDPGFYEQQIDDLARQILEQGISEAAMAAQEKLMEQIQEAERRARQLEANLRAAVYVDDPDSIGEE